MLPSEAQADLILTMCFLQPTRHVMCYMVVEFYIIIRSNLFNIMIHVNELEFKKQKEGQRKMAIRFFFGLTVKIFRRILVLRM